MPPEANIIARRVPIPVFGAGLVEAIADETILALEDPDDRNARRHQRPRRRASSTSAPGSGASAGSAGRRSTRRCGRSAPTPTATRWASPTSCSRTKLAAGVSRGADEAVRSDSRSRGSSPIAGRGSRHRQLRGVHEVPGASAARARSTTGGAGRRADLRRDRLRGVPRAGRCRPRRIAHPLFSRKAVPLFSDLLLHDVGTGDGIPQASALPERDPDAGALGPARPPSAAARRQRQHGRRGDRAPRWRGGRRRARRFDQLDARRSARR